MFQGKRLHKKTATLFAEFLNKYNNKPPSEFHPPFKKVPPVIAYKHRPPHTHRIDVIKLQQMKYLQTHIKYFVEWKSSVLTLRTRSVF